MAFGIQIIIMMNIAIVAGTKCFDFSQLLNQIVNGNRTDATYTDSSIFPYGSNIFNKNITFIKIGRSSKSSESQEHVEPMMTVIEYSLEDNTQNKPVYENIACIKGVKTIREYIQNGKIDPEDDCRDLIFDISTPNVEFGEDINIYALTADTNPNFDVLGKDFTGFDCVFVVFDLKEFSKDKTPEASPLSFVEYDEYAETMIGFISNLPTHSRTKAFVYSADKYQMKAGVTSKVFVDKLDDNFVIIRNTLSTYDELKKEILGMLEMLEIHANQTVEDNNNNSSLTDYDNHWHPLDDEFEFLNEATQTEDIIVTKSLPNDGTVQI